MNIILLLLVAFIGFALGMSYALNKVISMLNEMGIKVNVMTEKEYEELTNEKEKENEDENN